MKKIILSVFLMSASTVFAHEFPSQTGECFIVKNNLPQKSQNCEINSGGGAGGTYTAFKVNNINFLIEESDGNNISLGNDADSLQDGTFYYRDLKNKKAIISLQKARTTPAYYCAKQTKGNLDVCYIVN